MWMIFVQCNNFLRRKLDHLVNFLNLPRNLGLGEMVAKCLGILSHFIWKGIDYNRGDDHIKKIDNI